MRGLFLRAALPLALFVGGCGGGSAGSASSAPPVSTEIGQVSASYDGSLKPLVSLTSGSVNVTGVSGAKITALVTRPTSNLNQTFMVMVIGQNVFRRAFPNGDLEQVTTDGHALISCSINNKGQIAYDGFDNAGKYCVYICNSDGSGLHALTTSAQGQFLLPTWSPDGTKLSLLGDITTSKTVGTNSPILGNIYTMNANGTGLAKITSGEKNFGPATWSPDGHKFATGVVSGTTVDIFTVPVTGGSYVNVTPQNMQADLSAAWDWSPDGKSIACANLHDSGSGAAERVVLFDPAVDPTLNLVRVITPSGSSDDGPRFSPDSRFLIHLKYSTASDSRAGFYYSDTSGLNEIAIQENQHTAGFLAPAWSKFYPSQAIIGPSGVLGTSTSAFFVSQKGDVFASLVCFDAGTPASVTITPSGSGGGNAPLVFTVNADSIGKVSWINGYFNPKQGFATVAGTKQMLLSFSADTGLMNFAAPATVRGVQPSVSKSGVAQGDFAGVYDRFGRNLAPNGARTIRFDPRSGKLISAI